MTRDYNKPRRDDSRPSFRRSPSSRSGEERSPRPARPRLNRETVDRAWESGAQQQHADYHPRSTNTGNGQGSRDGWRNNRTQRPSEYPSRNNRDGNRPYGNRQGDYRENSRGFNGPSSPSQGPRSRSFGSDRRTFDDQRPNSRGGYSDRPYGQDRRPDSRENGPQRPYGQYRGQDSRFRDRDNNRDNPRRSFEQGSRPRNFERGGGSQRSFGRDEQTGRRFEGNSDYRSPRNFDRDGGPRRSFNREDHYDHDNRSPRRFDRNEQFGRGDYQRERQQPYRQNRSFSRPDPTPQYEGDYEPLSGADVPQRPRRPEGRPFSGRREQPVEAQRHVTQLPDGRIIKGSRPEQRKNAAFWTNISENTGELLQQVHVPAEDEELTKAVSAPAVQETEADEEKRTPTKRKPRASHPPRPDRGNGRKKSITPRKPRSTGPKPSQRGFKWPTPAAGNTETDTGI